MLHKMDHFAVLLIILQLHGTSVKGNVVDATQHLTQKMTLNCVYPGTANITQVAWKKNSSSRRENVAVYDSQHGVHIADNYKNRVGFVNSDYDSKDRSLFFSQTLLTDAGLYTCSVHTFPDGIWEKKIQVVQADHFEETLSSTSTYMAMLGQNATFTCLYTLGGTVQQVTWEKIGAESLVTIALCNLSKGQVVQSYGTYYKDRSLIFCDGLLSSRVTIWTISASDEGLYRCHFAADTGNQTIVISLTLDSGSIWHSEVIFIIGGAALFVGFVIIVIITITIHCLKKKKRKREAKKRARKAKAALPKHTRPANSYGRQPTCEDRRPGSTAPTCQNESLYVNCRDFSCKANAGR